MFLQKESELTTEIDFFHIIFRQWNLFVFIFLYFSQGIKKNIFIYFH